MEFEGQASNVSPPCNATYGYAPCICAGWHCRGAHHTPRVRNGVRDDARSESSASSASGSAGSANLTVIGTDRIVELCGSSVGIADSSVWDDMG